MNSLTGDIEVQEIAKMPPHRKPDLANAVDRTKECKLSSGSLYPVYLPLQVQHKLLVEIQRMLEIVCFGFGVQKMQCVLKQKDWDCAEAVELKVWTGVLRPREALFTKAEIEDLGRPYTTHRRASRTGDRQFTQAIPARRRSFGQIAGE